MILIHKCYLLFLDTSVGGTELDISHSFRVNGIDACPFIADVFLLPNTKKGYYLLTVGKNGEVFGNERLDIELYHKFFRSNRCVTCTVTTDKNGLSELGKFDNITPIIFHRQSSLKLKIC